MSAPTPYADPRRCDAIRADGKLAPPCMVCSLHNLPATLTVQWVVPLAKRDAGGVWTCATVGAK